MRQGTKRANLYTSSLYVPGLRVSTCKGVVSSEIVITAACLSLGSPELRPPRSPESNQGS